MRRRDYTKEDRSYAKYCLRYAVAVLGKAKVRRYIDSLDKDGDRRGAS